MLCSGNDAAVALAEYVGGSVEGFAVLMNEKANSLGLINTHFVTPHGLDNDEHYTTAYELAILSNYALNNKVFSNIVGTKNYTVNINGYSKALSNTNELLGNLNGVYGIKTGFTNGANRCLVTSCKRDNLDIICVVLGADTKKFRTSDSIKLINYCFTNYEVVNIKKLLDDKFNKWKENNSNYFSILKGNSNFVEISLEDLKTPNIPIKKNLIDKLDFIFDCKSYIEAPLFQNTVLGEAKVLLNHDIVVTTNILSNNSIKKKNIIDYFYSFMKNYPSYFSNLIY